MKGECNLCSTVLSLYRLRQCNICKKRYCRSCMTMNLWSELRDLICLNCARRIVTPRSSASKYDPLGQYLRYRGNFTRKVKLSFPRIEGIIKNNLPLSAVKSEAWWDNKKTSQGKAWMNAGWRVEHLDIEGRSVTFLRTGPRLPLKREPSRSRKKTRHKQFQPVRVKPRAARRPSKTHIAKVIARAKNIERRHLGKSKKPTRLKLKPKSAYEKRLYKPDARPTSQD